MKLYLALLIFVSGVLNAQSLIDPAVVCMDKSCSFTDQNVSRETIYNKLDSLLSNNIGTKIQLCQADPSSKVCINDGLVFDILSSGARSKVDIYSAILSYPIENTSRQFNYVMNYTLEIDGTFPDCQGALTQFVVPNNRKVFIENPDFVCEINRGKNSKISITYQIDYINLDYGVLGGTYHIGVSGGSIGGGTGYALMKFPYPANQNNTVVTEYKVGGGNVQVSARGK